MAGSLTKRFIYRILLILLVGQTFIWGWSFLKQKASLEDRLNEVVSLGGGIVARTAATSILSYDYTYLEQLLDDISRTSEILYVEVLDHTGKRLIYKGDEIVRGGYRTASFPVMAGQEALGKVRIKYSTEGVRKDILFHLVTTVMLQAVVLLGLVLLISLFFRRDIGGRIEAMSADIERVTSVTSQ